MATYVYPDMPDDAEVTWKPAPVGAYFVDGHSLGWKSPTDSTLYNEAEAKHWAAAKVGRRESCCLRDGWNGPWCGEFEKRFGLAPKQ